MLFVVLRFLWGIMYKQFMYHIYFCAYLSEIIASYGKHLKLVKPVGTFQQVDGSNLIVIQVKIHDVKVQVSMVIHKSGHGSYLYMDKTNNKKTWSEQSKELRK